MSTNRFKRINVARGLANSVPNKVVAHHHLQQEELAIMEELYNNDF